MRTSTSNRLPEQRELDADRVPTRESRTRAQGATWNGCQLVFVASEMSFPGWGPDTGTGCGWPQERGPRRTRSADGATMPQQCGGPSPVAGVIAASFHLLVGAQPRGPQSTRSTGCQNHGAIAPDSPRTAMTRPQEYRHL
eukprot:3558123-Rhodomonas_salina.3